MISALKRLVTTNNEPPGANSTSSPAHGVTVNSSDKGPTTQPTSQTNTAQGGKETAHSNATTMLSNGLQMISQSLQKKFSKGVNYNMKIVIRGDCNVGKTCLFQRLQGQPFKELYETSDEIHVSNIQWNYKTTDDVVKVEVWDVVDRSKKKRNLIQQKASNSGSLKLDNAAKSVAMEAALDAEFIDVYKNAHGCVLVYDITKQWTWDYIERELPKIPTHLPVLIIGNHRDMHHHRTVDELKCRYFIENLNRGSLGSSVRYIEASMRTGFGLKYIYKFFNVPFLQLQRENLMQQLEINAKEMDLACDELIQMEENMQEDYDAFSQNLNSQRRKQQEENAKEILKDAKSIEEARKLAVEKEAAEKAAKLAELEKASEPKKAINNILNKINTKVSQIQPHNVPVSMSVTLNPDKITPNTIPTSNNTLANSVSNKSTSLIAEELTNDEEFKRFLDDAKPTKSASKLSNLNNYANQLNLDDDEKDEDVLFSNPMVAAFKETIDSSDEEKKTTMNKATNKAGKVAVLANLSESEGDESVVNITSSPSISKSIKTDDVPNLNADNLSNEPLVNTTTEAAQMTSVSSSNLKFNNDDFEFLEKMTTSTTSSLCPKSNEMDSKLSSKMNSSDNQSDNLVVSSSKEQTSKKKKVKSGSKSKGEKEKKSSKKKTSSSKTASTVSKDDEDDDDDAGSNVFVKKDVDYEEI